MTPNKKLIKKIKSYKLLILILIFALILRIIFFTGLNWSDDPEYVSDAYRVTKGDFFLGAYLPGLRKMMIYPIALFFWLFGVSNLSATSYTLICSLSEIILIYYFGKTFFDVKTGILAAFFLSIFPLDIVYASWPMPDVPLAFFSALSIFLFLKSKSFDGKKFYKIEVKKLILFFSGITVGVAYLIKESGLIPLLFIIPYILYETFKKRKIDFDYSFLFIGFLLIFLIEGLFYYYKTGDFLLRYHVVSDFYRVGRAGMNTNLMYYPLLMFNLSNNFSFILENLYFVPYGLFYYFIFFSILYSLLKKVRKIFFIVFWFLIFFIYLEFGSMSFKQYIPIHKLDRHLIVLQTPGLLILSFSLIDILKNFRKSSRLKKFTKLGFVIFTICFLFFTSIYYASNIHAYLDASTWDMKEIYNFLKDYPNKKIYTDIGTISHLRFYFHFQNDENLKNLAYVKNSTEMKESFVVVYGSRGAVENTLSVDNIPDFVYKSLNEWKLVKVISGPKIDIFGTYDPKIYYV